MKISPDITKWLLDNNDPSLQYRVLTELLDFSEEDKDVKFAKSKINESTAVTGILNSMHPDGYWLQENPRSKIVYGAGVEYGAFATTHFCLSYLSELGMTKECEQIAKATERYLSLQKDDGDWWNHYSCLFSYNIRTFIRLGYRIDPRLQKTIDLLLNTTRPDGGYLCNTHENKSQTRKSCIRGAVKALMAFAEMPEYWQHPRCLHLVDYFLKRNGIFDSSHSKLVNRDMETISLPINWRCNVWEVLWALSKMGYGNRPELKEAWEYFETFKNESEQYILAWTPIQSPWKIGKRGKPNAWATFYSLLAKKMKNTNVR
jgi:hypothetical protein